MTVALKNFYQGQLTTSAVAVVTCPASTKYRVTQCNALNVTGGAVTMTLHRVASAGSPAATTQLTSAHSLAANTAYQCPEVVGIVLEAGETLQALASANTSITMAISGQVVT